METMLTDERFSPYLQDSYYTQREDRYVLPVRTDGKGFVRGIVHGTSQSAATLFIEPEEIVDLNNRMKLAEAEVGDEGAASSPSSGWVAEEADAFTQSTDAAETLDVIAAAARMADDTVSAEPIIDDAPRIGLLHARHPLMLLADRRCVANDVTVAAGTTLLVSGPNAGGKTVALKTVGLAALMARAGLHLTAESGSVIGWFTSVVTDIGDAQNLEKDLSTFSGHMVNLRDLLATAGAGTLVLIDEIAVGTDPDQGAALAQAVLEALAARGVTCLVTTHYERLKALGASDPRFANASVGFDLDRLEPTFKLHLGSPGSSGALAVAKRMGIATPVVERARELLGRRHARRGAARECRRSAPSHRGRAGRAARKLRDPSAPHCARTAIARSALREANARRTRRSIVRATQRSSRDRGSAQEGPREGRARHPTTCATRTASSPRRRCRRAARAQAQATARHARDAGVTDSGHAGDRALGRCEVPRRPATARSRSASVSCARWSDHRRADRFAPLSSPRRA